ncbi:MAG: hypothetical protein K2P53_05975 [Rickettsiales bacterium]|jgi:hypothetical protein|nr:hypothetical protein [Rickettsiales bacterium]
MTNKKTVITSIDGGGVKDIIPVMTISENFEYLKNGIYSLANNLKTPVKLMAAILTISHEGFKLFNIKLSTKHSLINSGNEFLEKYYIDELKSIFAIASASYSIKANLSETHKSTECLSNNSDITDYTNLDADTHYDTSEPILL